MSESMSEVFTDMPVSEVVSVSEVMTLSDSMSESVSEVPKNLVSVSESDSETDSDTKSCPKSCPCPLISGSDLEYHLIRKVLNNF